MDESRRRFLKAAVAAGGIAWVAPSLLSAAPFEEPNPLTTTTDPSSTTTEPTSTTEPGTTTTEASTTTTTPAGRCLDKQPWAVPLAGIVGCGVAGGGKTAGEVALADFLAKLRQTCVNAQDPNDSCLQHRTCPNITTHDCLVRTPKGSDFKEKQLDLRQGVGPGCPAGTEAHVLVPTKEKKEAKDKGPQYLCRCDCVPKP